MYILGGGATTLFHLLVRHPILVLAFGLAGIVSSNPGIGDRYGTDSSLRGLEQSLVRQHPELAMKMVELQRQFDAFDARATDDQMHQVLKITDAATDVGARDVLANPEERRQAAFLLYLDVYAREGPRVANQLFSGSGPPRKK